jgi:hypothetical protein
MDKTQGCARRAATCYAGTPAALVRRVRGTAGSRWLCCVAHPVGCPGPRLPQVAPRCALCSTARRKPIIRLDDADLAHASGSHRARASCGPRLGGIWHDAESIFIDRTIQDGTTRAPQLERRRRPSSTPSARAHPVRVLTSMLLLVAVEFGLCPNASPSRLKLDGPGLEPPARPCSSTRRPGQRLLQSPAVSWAQRPGSACCRAPRSAVLSGRRVLPGPASSRFGTRLRLRGQREGQCCASRGGARSRRGHPA